MKPAVIIGFISVTIALICYVIAVWKEQRTQLLSGPVLFFFTAGLVSEAGGIIGMTLAATKPPFTVHGMMGYSAFVAMIVLVFAAWKLRLGENRDKAVPPWLHHYIRYVFIYWVITYITGVVVGLSLR